MNITITVRDENLDYMSKAECLSFESASGELWKLARNYDRRVEMESDKADVMAEAQKEEIPF